MHEIWRHWLCSVVFIIYFEQILRIALVFLLLILNMPVEITLEDTNPASNYMFQVNFKNTRTRCEICSKLTMKIPERRHIFIVNFEHISHPVLLFLLLTLSK